MYAHELYEQNKPKIVVTYPGRFQPFHQGHAGVFAQLQKKFGGDSVYILTSNDTSSAKSPFNFSDKYQLITAAGVSGDKIIETNQMYKLPDSIDAANTIFITAVGAPDADRLNPDTFTKRDQKDKEGNITKPAGSPSYYKIWGSAETPVTADRHGYVIVIPEIHKEVTIKGKKYDVSHGTECRNLWNSIRNDAKARTEFLSQMYARPSQELAAIFDKIPQTTAEDIGADSQTSTSPIHGTEFKQGVAEDLTRRGFLRGLGAAAVAGAAGSALAGTDDLEFPNRVQKMHSDMMEKNPRYAKEHEALGIALARGFIGAAAENNKRWYQKTAELLQKYGVNVNEGVAEGLSEKINPKTLTRGFVQEKDMGWYTLQAVGDFASRMANEPPTMEIYAMLKPEAGQRDGKQIGQLSLKIAQGRFLKDNPGAEALVAGGVDVDAAYQRKGVASSMYQFAKELGNDVIASVDQSDDAVAMWKGMQAKGVAEDAAGVGVVAKNKKMARDPRYSMSITKDVKPSTPKNMLRAFRLSEDGGASKEEIVAMIKQFLPLAMKELEIKELPRIILKKHIEAHDGQATFGRFVNEEEKIYLGIASRHPVDILRTLAHELVHFKQYTDGKMYHEAGETGSPIENEANVKAAIIMRHFNKKYPDAVKADVLNVNESLLAKYQLFKENFADGRNPQDKGDSKRHGVPTKASVSTLRKVAKQGGRKGQLAHWMANMKAGKAKKK